MQSSLGPGRLARSRHRHLQRAIATKMVKTMVQAVIRIVPPRVIAVASFNSVGSVTPSQRPTNATNLGSILFLVLSDCLSGWGYRPVPSTLLNCSGIFQPKVTSLTATLIRARRAVARLCLAVMPAVAQFLMIPAAHANDSLALFFGGETATVSSAPPRAWARDRSVDHFAAGGVRALIAAQVSAQLARNGSRRRCASPTSRAGEIARPPIAARSASSRCAIPNASASRRRPRGPAPRRFGRRRA